MQHTIVFLISLISWFTYLLYPNQISLFLSYFILWWSGLEMCRLYMDSKINFNHIKKINLYLIFMIFATSIPLFYNEFISIGRFPFINFRHFFSVLIIINLGVLWYKFRFRFISLFNIFETLSPISYAVYIIHFPILSLSFFDNILVDLFFNVFIIMILSYLIEVLLQPKFNKLLKI